MVTSVDLSGRVTRRFSCFTIELSEDLNKLYPAASISHVSSKYPSGIMPFPFASVELYAHTGFPSESRVISLKGWRSPVTKFLLVYLLSFMPSK